ARRCVAVGALRRATAAAVADPMAEHRADDDLAVVRLAVVLRDVEEEPAPAVLDVPRRRLVRIEARRREEREELGRPVVDASVEIAVAPLRRTRRGAGVRGLGPRVTGADAVEIEADWRRLRAPDREV